MSESERNPHQPPSDDEAVDLLVDGELDEAQRRGLLSRLDERPEGWRRLALAFLEAQCWKREMPALVRAARQPAPCAGPPPRRRWPEGRVATALAMGASFLLALGLGTLLRDLALPRVDGPVSGPLAENGKAPAPPAGLEDRALAGRTGPEQAESPWEFVTLGAGEGPDGSRRAVRVPVRPRPSLDEEWLGSFPPAMPEEVQRALRRAGSEVRQSREYLPIWTEDGRHVVVPVDQVDVHYVGGKKTYQ